MFSVVEPQGIRTLLADVIVRLDHIGIAVTHLDGAISRYVQSHNAVVRHREVNEEQHVAEAMLTLPDTDFELQLLAATSEDSTIAKFLSKNGEGVQQIAYEVSDIEMAMKILENHGIPLIYQLPVYGTEHSIVNFIHPRYCDGNLVELVEKVVSN